jgi:hypothetical protein
VTDSEDYLIPDLIPDEDPPTGGFVRVWTDISVGVNCPYGCYEGDDRYGCDGACMGG